MFQHSLIWFLKIQRIFSGHKIVIIRIIIIKQSSCLGFLFLIRGSLLKRPENIVSNSSSVIRARLALVAPLEAPLPLSLLLSTASFPSSQLPHPPLPLLSTFHLPHLLSCLPSLSQLSPFLFSSFWPSSVSLSWFVWICIIMVPSCIIWYSGGWIYRVRIQSHRYFQA